MNFQEFLNKNQYIIIIISLIFFGIIFCNFLRKYWIRHTKLILIDDALQILYEKLGCADKVLADSRNKFLQMDSEVYTYFQLLEFVRNGSISFYGYKSLVGLVSHGQKIKKIPLNEIPELGNSGIYQNNWGDHPIPNKRNYAIILRSSEKPKYVGIAIKKRELDKLIRKTHNQLYKLTCKQRLENIKSSIMKFYGK